MKKFFVTMILLTAFVLFAFGMQDSAYRFQLLNIEAATETVSFQSISEDVWTFESLTDLHFQMQNGVYSAKGQIDKNLIVDYQLTLFYNGGETQISCKLETEQLQATAGDKNYTIEIKQPLLILDNNLSWTWQLVYNLYRINEHQTINIFIPQLLLKNFTDILTIEIQKVTQTEEHTNVFFSLNGQSGMLKINEDGQVIQLLMGGTIMERIL
ncbi:MAG TPA: hypothetical protein P5107_07765 [Thermotogota bacterium]|nr:hypothetical protein [Thermotogota bacterium]HRW34937.1 hypothetical protein [Thermotogota bacterium]